MPRKARELSRTNIYHVMLRGINRQTIFEDNEDMNCFLTEVRRCKDISDFKLYAFCLMSNHVHLLLETDQEPLDMIFRRLGSRYAGWYNRKYGRVGHLFQDRYRSEKVETEQYFLTALRYILQNPMKAGLEQQPGSYRWSSYLAYEKGIGLITDIQYAVSMAGNREDLIRFLREANDDQLMDEADRNARISDEQAKEVMKQVTGFQEEGNTSITLLFCIYAVLKRHFAILANASGKRSKQCQPPSPCIQLIVINKCSLATS